MIYFDTPTKIRAREITIFDIYQREFSMKMPADKQYWTLGGPSYDRVRIHKDCELYQAEKIGIIKREQFHSVDIKESVTNNNRNIKDAHWYQGDFLDAMKLAHHYGQFNPGVINCDLFNMVRLGASYFSRIMDFLVVAEVKNCLAIGNFVFESPHEHNTVSFNGDMEIIHEYISKLPGISRACANGWIWPTHTLKYYSVRKNQRNHMLSIVLFNK